VAQKGVRNVALITGEEKIVPPDAKWFSCTVEAMPLDREAEFVAVDEIQLRADCGHVFTERLLPSIPRVTGQDVWRPRARRP
jgi:ATP-dependent RNA helicase SUPV3L1/SUV3